MSGGTALVLQDSSSVGEDLTLAGVISGNDDLVKRGSGTLILTADNTLIGTITLLEGTLLVDGSQPGIPIVVAGGSLGGTGPLGPITLNGGRIDGPVVQASPIHPGRRDLVVRPVSARATRNPGDIPTGTGATCPMPGAGSPSTACRPARPGGCR